MRELTPTPSEDFYADPPAHEETSVPGWARPHALDRRDVGIALVVFACVVGALMGTLDMGLTRDESFYFHAAYEYVGWFDAIGRDLKAGAPLSSFTRAGVDKYWSYNAEHPALIKTLFTLSYKFLHRDWGLLSLVQALRLPGIVMTGWLASMTYLFGRQVFGRLAGLLAVGALMLQPRLFFHAHMTCFDAPMAAMWFAVVYAYWRSFGSRRWALGAGVLWGLALGTKLNAFFLPIVLVGHWLLTHGATTRVRREESGVGVVIPAMPWALVAMAVIGPILFFLHWPRIWFDTYERVRWYMAFHLKHDHYFVWYFGQNLVKPPFPRAFAWVMTLVTVPATILTAGGLGAFAVTRQREVASRARRTWAAIKARRWDGTPTDPRGTGLLLAINVLFPIALISQPNTPVFGGTKHWMTAMPYLAMLAGAGVVYAADQVAQWWAARRAAPLSPAQRAGLAAALSIAMLTTPAIATARYYRFGTSYYNTLIGGPRGAADRKMMRQFWGYTSRQAFDWLNANAPKNARIYTHNTTGWAWRDYQREGLVRRDLRASGLEGCDYALYHHQKAFHHVRHELWDRLGTRAPVHVVTVDGVPLLSVYEHPRTRKRRLGAAGKTTAR